jgi:hypothetical protein
MRYHDLTAEELTELAEYVNELNTAEKLLPVGTPTKDYLQKVASIISNMVAKLKAGFSEGNEFDAFDDIYGSVLGGDIFEMCDDNDGIAALVLKGVAYIIEKMESFLFVRLAEAEC